MKAERVMLLLASVIVTSMTAAAAPRPDSHVEDEKEPERIPQRHFAIRLWYPLIPSTATGPNLAEITEIELTGDPEAKSSINPEVTKGTTTITTPKTIVRTTGDPIQREDEKRKWMNIIVDMVAQEEEKAKMAYAYIN